MGNREQEHLVLLSGGGIKGEADVSGMLLSLWQELFHQRGGGNLGSACMPLTNRRSQEAEVGG